jgi:hypothetical protein
MTKQVAQGTTWESEIVKIFEALGFFAARQPKTAKHSEGDVLLLGPGDRQIPVVMWKQFRQGNGNGHKRVGHRTVTMNISDFAWLVVQARSGIRAIWIQAKATERLNAPKELRELALWAKTHGKVPDAPA